MILRLLLIACLAAVTPGSLAAQTARPAHGASHTVTEPAAGPPLVDINSADEKALDALPGIGPVRAKAIVANRPYTDKQQLVDRKVIPPGVFADIQDRVALVNVNTAPAATMAQVLPNVGPVRAQAIVDQRPYATLQDLVTKGALKQGILSGIKGLVTTGG